MTSPIDRSQLANFAVDPGALPVAASCVFPSHSRPSPPPRSDGSTRRGSLPGHPIPPTAPWPGTRIGDASPPVSHGVWRGADPPDPSNPWRRPSWLG
jgi:hypothetical protein